MSAEISDFLGLRKSERDFFGQYVIGERQKWRDHIRDQADAIQFVVESIGDTPESNKKAATSLRKIRTSIAVRLNPGDADDKDLLDALDVLIGKCISVCSDELVKDSKTVLEEISWLLKHDWNRVKYEARPIWHFWKSEEKVNRRDRKVTKSSVVCDAIKGLITLGVIFVLAVAVLAGLKWEWEWLSPKEAGDQSSVAVTPNIQRPKNETGGIFLQPPPVSITVTGATSISCPIDNSRNSPANAKNKIDGTKE
jgi:hypothetical protein